MIEPRAKALESRILRIAHVFKERGCLTRREAESLHRGALAALSMGEYRLYDKAKEIIHQNFYNLC